MPRKALILAVALLGLGLHRARPASDPAGDFGFVRPWFEPTLKEREQLAMRGVIVRILPSDDPQMSMIAVCAVAVSPEAFIERVHAAGDIERLEVTGGRFGIPPRLEDLRGASLDQADVERLRQCQPGNCPLNLSDGEIARMQRALAAPGGGQDTAQDTFRRILWNRTVSYASGGLETLPDYHDRRVPVRPAAIFSEIVRRSAYLDGAPEVAKRLMERPFAGAGSADSFLRWSQVTMNNKSVILVTHVSIERPADGPVVPAVLVIGKQVYASRYVNGELSLTMLFAQGSASNSYLVHVDRSDLDAFAGALSGLKRAVIEQVVKREATEALVSLRDRLERSHAAAR